MNHLRRTSAIGALALSAALFLTACSGGSGGAPTNAPVDKNLLEHTSYEALQAMIVADGAPAEPTGTVRYGSWISNNGFDPQSLTTHQGSNLQPGYEPLFQLDEKLEPLPWLVSEWDEVDETSVRLTLQEGVVFHDGGEWNAEALKANLDRAAATTTSPNYNMYQLVESVAVEDDLVALVTFTQPYPNFYYNFATTAGFMISPKALAEGRDLSSTPAGSGGWVFQEDEFVEGSKQVWEANTDYWNPDAVKIERIETNIYTDPTARLNAYSSGQIDIISYVPDANLALVETDDSRVFSDLTIATTFLLQDRDGTIVPALGDEKVRQAIGLLIDREGFNAAVLGNSGLPSGGFSSPALPWFNQELDERVRDVEASKELLAEAGYPDGFEFEVSSAPSIAQAVIAVQQMLAEGGITMNIVDLPPTDHTAAQRRGDYAATYIIPTAVDIDQWWSRSMSNEGTLNPFGLDDLADLEEEYVDSLTLPEADRAPVMQMLQEQVIERGVAFPLSLRSRIAAATDAVVAVQQPFFAPEDWSPRPYYLWLND
ncbi:ABC transporter substrate-binding protein [Microbacterium sp. NPDC055357]